MNIKRIVKNFIYGYKASCDRYIRHLRELGVEIGEDVSIYAPTKTLIDENYPWMISIGNHVRITEGVKILTHDYSWSVLKRYSDGDIVGASGKVIIGDNVFIGMNAIILRGVEIGDNVIIGAGSVVTKNCEPNSVYAGNPAVRVCELNVFYEKRKKQQIEEARTLAIEYYRRFSIFPPKEVFHEYFFLFADNNFTSRERWCEDKMRLCGNFEISKEYISTHTPPFHDYDEFLNFCFKDLMVT